MTLNEAISGNPGGDAFEGIIRLCSRALPGLDCVSSRSEARVTPWTGRIPLDFPSLVSSTSLGCGETSNQFLPIGDMMCSTSALLRDINDHQGH